MKMGFRYPILLVIVAVAALLACEPPEQTGTAGGTERIRLADYENYKDFGDYVLHVNALGTNQLPPDVARAAGIVRSENRGMLNVVILRKLEAQEDEPASGNVTVSAANLAGQLRSIDMRKVIDGDAIYYIGEFSVSNQETLVFDIDAIPDSQTAKLAVRYSKEFYTR